MDHCEEPEFWIAPDENDGLHPPEGICNFQIIYVC